MSKTLIFNLIILFFGVINASETLANQVKIPVRSFDFNTDRTIKLHSDSKNKVQLINIPNDVDRMQISIVGEDYNRPRARLVGKTIVENENNTIEFGVLMNKFDTNYTSRLSIKLKGYQKSGDAFEKVSETIIEVDPIICSGKEDPSCGLLKLDCTVNCPSGSVIEEYKTYNNQCELEKQGAMFLRSGACQ